MTYQPAVGYWRNSPRHVLLWTTIGVLDRIERQIPEERRLRRHIARLRRLIAGIVNRKLAKRLWDLVAKQQEPDIPDAALEAIIAAAIAAIASALFSEIRAIREDALITVERRFGQELIDELREQALREAFELVRNIPNTLKEELRDLARETMMEFKTHEDFARALSRRWAEFSRERAELIARTEWARVAGRVTVELYRMQGTRKKVWYTVGDARVCAICQQNAAAGPIPIDEPFPSGVDTVPAHPRCRCNVAGAI